jgi:hypothetical protein
VGFGVNQRKKLFGPVRLTHLLGRVICEFSWEEKLVAPLIATPNDVDRAIEDKKDGQKSYATGYTCNSRLQKGITILFCKQIGQCTSTNYASSLSGFKILGKLKWRELCSRQFLS